MKLTLVFAGFGGQGVLTAGRIIAEMALLDDITATWLPSYGFAVRGAKANCVVKLSDGRIGSPCLETIDVLVSMNAPSLEFAADVNPGGVIIVNSDQAGDEARKIGRSDVTVIPVACDTLAREAENPKAANLVALGAVVSRIDTLQVDHAAEALKEFFAAKGKQEFERMNYSAFMKGYNAAEVQA